MSTVNKLLEQRELPELLRFADGREVTAENWSKRRQEILSILENEIYGRAPEAPCIRTTVTDATKKYGGYGGKASVNEISIAFDTDKGEFSFPCVEVVPKTDKKVPVIVLINFRPDIPDRGYPAEEILDAGCAVIRIYCNDVALNGDDGFEGGIAAMYDREKYDWGKLRMWAFAMSRVIDYLETTDYADMSKIVTAGHSRLGKTSLICGAFDERVALVCANNSGCSGDAITRDKQGERVKFITKTFPYWFCDNYKKYVEKEHEMPFDQHFLVGAIAPRCVSLGAAVEDTWADPDSQYLSACAASEAWEMLGKKGFIHPDRLPRIEEYFDEGCVKYHLRSGEHFFSRTDWLVYLDAIKLL